MPITLLLSRNTQTKHIHFYFIQFSCVLHHYSLHLYLIGEGRMKNKAASYLKQIITVLTSMAKSKSLALKSKTNALKTRIIIFSLLQRHNTFFSVSSINHKLQSLLGHHQHHHHHESKQDAVEFADEADMVLHSNNAMTRDPVPDPTHTQLVNYANFNEYELCGNDREEEEKYPDLTHSLFGAEDDLELEGSVIELVKSSKQQEGEEFRLEDEIDQVADLFIKKFHRQMRLQKQQSIKRQQEMLQNGA